MRIEKKGATEYSLKLPAARVQSMEYGDHFKVGANLEWSPELMENFYEGFLE